MRPGCGIWSRMRFWFNGVSKNPLFAYERRMKTRLLLLFVLIFPLSSQALTPPLPARELEEKSVLIVEAEVLEPIICRGRVSENSCSDRLKFETSLKIHRVLKGKVDHRKTVPVTFFYYDYGKSNCTGDQAAILHVGDRGTYYLQKLEDGSYSPVHWSGVKVKTPGHEKLPPC